MKTEEQARKCWCPFAREIFLATNEDTGEASNTYMPSGNRLMRAYPEEPEMRQSGQSYCIASQCMAWRTLPHRRGQNETHGYCGLAGYPDASQFMPRSDVT